MGRKGKKEVEVNQSFKSPNLEAERRRRDKLKAQFMALRSHVPIITNMTNARILGDAITYIRELQKEKKNLLHEIDEEQIDEEETDQLTKPEHDETSDTKEEMKKLGIEENLEMCKIGERKYWLKMTIEKKAGIFTKFMDVMRFIGFAVIDISLTSSGGAMILVCSSVQILCDAVDLEQTKGFLLQAMTCTP